jgi:hypothetical protein
MHRETHTDPEVEGDLILGDLDPEDVSSVEHALPTKSRFGQGSVREDIEEIVKGTASRLAFSTVRVRLSSTT